MILNIVTIAIQGEREETHSKKFWGRRACQRERQNRTLYLEAEHTTVNNEQHNPYAYTYKIVGYFVSWITEI